jgi:Ni/Co efflux regulator RcnB
MRKLLVLLAALSMLTSDLALARDAADRADRADTNGSRNKIRQDRLREDKQQLRTLPDESRRSTTPIRQPQPAR